MVQDYQRKVLKKIVVASDSFKGCLSSLEVAAAVEAAVCRTCPHCEVTKVDVADGGEGTVHAVVSALKGKEVTAVVHDPLGRSVEAGYGIVQAEGGRTAVIEMAAASGLPLLGKAERNPLRTSTYGTGELILDALKRGCRHFLIGIGGSATNDAGTGMLSALGFRFVNAKGATLAGCGASLGEIVGIDDSHVVQELRQCDFVVACDVDTPFCGPEGAACVFAPQKGATAAEVKLLDEGMYSFAEVIRARYDADIIPAKGAGAAGGLGGAFQVFLGARLTKGIDMGLDVIGFDRMLEGADLVITGEGQIDYQTAKGKTVTGVLRRARQRGVPVWAIGGSVEDCEALHTLGLDGIYCINEQGTPVELALQKDYAKARIQLTVEELLKSTPDL